MPNSTAIKADMIILRLRELTPSATSTFDMLSAAPETDRIASKAKNIVDKCLCTKGSPFIKRALFVC